MSNLKITSIDAKICEFEIPDFGTDQNGTSLIYQAGNKKKVKSCAIQIHTNQGITGEFVGGDMNEVIEHNTSKLTDEDRDALAAFFTRHNSAGG